MGPVVVSTVRVTMNGHALQDMREHSGDLWEELLTERYDCL
jgi:hypothetical protein